MSSQATLFADNVSEPDTSISWERVELNVGGKCFCTFRHTLKAVRNTRLYELMRCPTSLIHRDHYDPQAKVYFFDRHPGIFEYILNYYRTGELHVPRDICWPVFNNELLFWGLDHTHLESCCWQIYRSHEDNENTLKALDEEDKQECVDPRLLKEDSTACEKRLASLWEMCDDPMSSKMAKAFALLSLTLILASVALFCLETHEYFLDTRLVNSTSTLPDGTITHKIRRVSEPKAYLMYIEAVCVLWFCFEILLRFVSCPDKCQFVRSPLNIIDFLAVLPFFFSFMDTSDEGENQAAGILRVIRILRVFRVFKLTRHSTGLKILWHTLHASMKELFILGIFMCLGVVIFASLIYYAERLTASTDEEESEVLTDFKDIPHGFWWALVTMTTLGYGDMVPRTFAGQVVGSLCALCGLLTIALPVPVIVSNFSLYYSHYQAKNKLPRNQQQAMFRKELQNQDDQDPDQEFKDAIDNTNPENKFQNEVWHKDGGVSLMVPKVPEVAISPTSENHINYTSNLASNPLEMPKEPENPDLYLQIKKQDSATGSGDCVQNDLRNDGLLQPSNPRDDLNLLPGNLTEPRPSTTDSEEPTSDSSTLPDNSSSIPFIDLTPVLGNCSSDHHNDIKHVNNNQNSGNNKNNKSNNFTTIPSIGSSES